MKSTMFLGGVALLASMMSTPAQAQCSGLRTPLGLSCCKEAVQKGLFGCAMRNSVSACVTRGGGKAQPQIICEGRLPPVEPVAQRPQQRGKKS